MLTVKVVFQDIFNSALSLSLAISAGDLLADVEGLSNKPIRAGFAMGLTTTRADVDFGLALFTRKYSVAGAIIHFTQQDRELINRLISFSDFAADTLGIIEPYVNLFHESETRLQLAWDSGGIDTLESELKQIIEDSGLKTDQESLLNLVNTFETLYGETGTEISQVNDFTQVPGLVQALQSSIELRAAVITESGVSLSRSFPFFNGIEAGLNIKSIRFVTVDYIAPVNQATATQFNFSEASKVYVDPNFDLGLSKALDKNWRAGLMIRNLIDRNYQTVRDNTIKLRPLARIGLSYQSASYRLVSDLDITRNDPIGFDLEKQYLAMGVEFRKLPFVQLRLGLRYNLGDDTQPYSLGIGSASKHIIFDVAAAGYGDELGLALQLGVSW